MTAGVAHAVQPEDAAGDGEGPAALGTQVVDRVIDILELFGKLGQELGVSEIGRALGLKKATAHRLVATLRRRGLLAQDPVTRRYRLGVKLWELGSLAVTQVDWVDRVKPFLQQLTEASGETSHLAVLNDGQVLYMDVVESRRALRMPSQVGKGYPVHCTDVGKAQIAFLPPEVLQNLVARRGLPAATPSTITDVAKLQVELAEIRERGYSVDREEIEEGLVGIGAPIRDHTAHVVAAISIAGPSSRLRPDTIEAHALEVMRIAHGISAVLGCPPDLLGPAPGDRV